MHAYDILSQTMNYISLDNAYNDTYMSHKFDVESAKHHSPEFSYEKVIDKLNTLKARSCVPINEQEPAPSSNYPKELNYPDYPQDYSFYHSLSGSNGRRSCAPRCNLDGYKSNNVRCAPNNCGNTLSHIQGCNTCRGRLQSLIESQMSRPAYIQPKKIQPWTQHLLYCLLISVAIVAVIGVMFDVSININKKRGWGDNVI